MYFEYDSYLEKNRAKETPGKEIEHPDRTEIELSIRREIEILNLREARLTQCAVITHMFRWRSPEVSRPCPKLGQKNRASAQCEERRGAPEASLGTRV